MSYFSKKNFSNEIDYNKNITNFQKQDSNKICLNCNEIGTPYVDLSHGTFVCARCSGILRELNFKIKGISVSNFNEKEYNFIISNGNKKAKEFWLKIFEKKSEGYPDPKNYNKVRQHIINTYINKLYINHGEENEKEDKNDVKLKENNKNNNLKNIQQNNINSANNNIFENIENNNNNFGFDFNKFNNNNNYNNNIGFNFDNFNKLNNSNFTMDFNIKQNNSNNVKNNNLFDFSIFSNNNNNNNKISIISNNNNNNNNNKHLNTQQKIAGLKSLIIKPKNKPENNQKSESKEKKV